ncbi:MAG: Guanylate kinase [Candidatus Parcubacteria bacterium]|nr:Guanylate kinase [Candidatus Parcubacteria bacterium]
MNAEEQLDSQAYPAARPLLLVVAGPAGSGKTTLCDRLIHEHPDFNRVITATTRKPREGEIDGVHYHFLDVFQFQQKINRHEFIEWTSVHSANRLYGTLRSSVIAPLLFGKNLILNIDVKGVESFRQMAAANTLIKHSLHTVFIRVDHKKLLERMITRDKDHPEEIALRMATAEAEMLEAPKFDSVIESGTRDEDFASLCSIVQKARARIAA